MSSGTSSAQSPCPSQAIGLTRSSPAATTWSRQWEQRRTSFATPTALEMQLDLVSKEVERARDEPRRAIRVPTRASSAHDVYPACQLRAVVSLAGCDAFDAVRNRGEAVHARPALASTLAREIPRDSGDLVHRARVRRQRHDRTCSERPPCGARSASRSRNFNTASARSQVPK